MAAARGLALPLAALTLGVVVVWLGTGPLAPASSSDLTVDEVYRRTEQELRRNGGIYQVTIAVSDDMGILAYSGTIRRWVDAQRDLSRDESDLGAFGASTLLTTRDARYVRERDGGVTTTSGHVWRCHGVGVAASVLLGCPGPTERSTTAVAQGQYEGRATIVLVTTGSSSGSDETLTFTRRLHLAPRTFLPVALESEGQIDFGQITPTRQLHTYSGSFVRPDALPADLFDPASIGYAALDPARVLDGATDLVVHWLGASFQGERGLPDLVLSKVETPAHGPGYRYLLYYARADDRFGPPVVSLQLWPRSAWDAVIRSSQGLNAWDDPCWSRAETPLPNGRTVVISGFATGVIRAPQPPSAAPGQCPSVAYDKFLAQAFIGDTVVLLDAPPVFRGGSMTASPYNTFDGISTLARALHRR